MMNSMLFDGSPISMLRGGWAIGALLFIVLYAWLREDKEKPTAHLLLKAVLYFVEIVAIQVVLASLAGMLDFPLSKMTSDKSVNFLFFRIQLGLLLGGALGAVAAEFMASRMEPSRSFHLREAASVLNVLATSTAALYYTSTWFAAIFAAAPGAAFHRPFSGTLVYLPAAVLLGMLHHRMFLDRDNPWLESWLPGELSDRLASVQESAAGLMQNAPVFGGAQQQLQQQPMVDSAQQPSGAMGASQPIGGQQPQQQMGAATSQQPGAGVGTGAPAAQAGGASQPMICPTCGKPATFYPQYNRYYCHNCQKWL